MTRDPDRLEKLRAVYDFYQDVTGDWATACEPGCPACCTDQVTVTSVEARLILGSSQAGKIQEILDTLDFSAAHKPGVTFNQLARLCLDQQEPPEKPEIPARPCPFLFQEQCRIYAVRPFGCRALFSKKTCRSGGWADMEPLWLTVNQVFCQVIEHLDVPGYSGNLISLLGWIKNGESQDKAKQMGLLENIHIPGLLVPPEHRKDLATIVRYLTKIVS